jgi:nucleoside-diphosphate-sugar epimerase
MMIALLKFAKRIARRILNRILSPFKKLQAQKNARMVRRERIKYANSPIAKVFLTGDLGVLGSLVADRLKHDYEIIGYDLRGSSSENLSNFRALSLKMKGCEYVVHAAAIPHPNKGSIQDYVNVNVLGTLNVLKAAEANNVKRVIYISSTAYYGCDIQGKLLPAYFPIDESHPIASIQGYSVGGLDRYNQSKVMSEQLLAYYGTNKLFQVVILRLAPSNRKSNSYPSDFNWRECTDWRRGCFFTNCDPLSVVDAIDLAINYPGELWYEAFNIADKYVHESIDVREFLKEEYPTVEIRKELGPHSQLIDTTKAEQVLGFIPSRDLK